MLVDKTESEPCWKCDGTGKLRNNHGTPDGCYVFENIQCDICEGTGEVKYEECEDCGALTPVAFAAEHSCGE